LSNHTVIAFDVDLQAIRAEIISMAQLVEQQIAGAAAALVNRDAEIAGSVIAMDVRVNEMLHEIETKVVETVARRQPFAVDLREIIGAFHISHDLERSGDLAKNICKRVMMLDIAIPETLIPNIQSLAMLALRCFRRVLDSYVERDEAKAADVWNSDKEIDEVQNSLFGEVLVCMMSDPRNITSCTHLLFCLKNLERMGDHATNIAESVRFMVKGDRFIGDRPKANEAHPAVMT